MELELMSMRGLAPRTSVASWLQSKSKPCRQSELARWFPARVYKVRSRKNGQDRLLLRFHFTLNRVIYIFFYSHGNENKSFERRSSVWFSETKLSTLQLVMKLTSKEYADEVRTDITDNQTQPIEHYEPAFDSVDDSGTSHVSVLAPDGGAVSMTSSINL